MTDIVARQKYSLRKSYGDLRKEDAVEIMRLRATSTVPQRAPGMRSAIASATGAKGEEK